MKKITFYGFILLAVLALGGCIETTTLIKVKRDGSGTIEQTVIISNTFKELMTEMSGEEMEEEALFDEEELQGKAEQIGQGVLFVSAEPFSTAKGEGYRAIYCFEDITKIRVNQNPGENLPSAEEQEAQKEFFEFRFQKGDPATLVILRPSGAFEQPEQEEQESTGEVSLEENPEMMEMMRTLYRDMRLAIAVEVDGTIVDTNATYREGSTVTVLDMDFGKLLEDEESFRALVTAQPNSIEEAKELLENRPGIKVELQDELKIRFR